MKHIQNPKRDLHHNRYNIFRCDSNRYNLQYILEKSKFDKQDIDKPDNVITTDIEMEDST